MDLLLSIVAGALAGAGVVTIVLSLGRARDALPMVVGGAVAAAVAVALVVVARPDSALEYIGLVAMGIVAAGGAVFLFIAMDSSASDKPGRATEAGQRADEPSPRVVKVLDAKEPPTVDELRAIGKRGDDFTEVVAEVFRRMGYRVTPAERGSEADLTLSKEGRTAVAQVKKWSRQAPDLPSVQALAHLALATRCFEAYVLSPHEASGDVVAWSRDPEGQKGLRGGLFLITGEDLLDFLEPVRYPQA